jgi:hypothetical protein
MLPKKAAGDFWTDDEPDEVAMADLLKEVIKPTAPVVEKPAPVVEQGPATPTIPAEDEDIFDKRDRELNERWEKGDHSYHDQKTPESIARDYGSDTVEIGPGLSLPSEIVETFLGLKALGFRLGSSSDIIQIASMGSDVLLDGIQWIGPNEWPKIIEYLKTADISARLAKVATDDDLMDVSMLLASLRQLGFAAETTSKNTKNLMLRLHMGTVPQTAAIAEKFLTLPKEQLARLDVLAKDVEYAQISEELDKEETALPPTPGLHSVPGEMSYEYKDEYGKSVSQNVGTTFLEPTNPDYKYPQSQGWKNPPTKEQPYIKGKPYTIKEKPAPGKIRTINRKLTDRPPAPAPVGRAPVTTAPVSMGMGGPSQDSGDDEDTSEVEETFSMADLLKENGIETEEENASPATPDLGKEISDPEGPVDEFKDVPAYPAKTDISSKGTRAIGAAGSEFMNGYWQLAKESTLPKHVSVLSLREACPVNVLRPMQPSGVHVIKDEKPTDIVRGGQFVMGYKVDKQLAMVIGSTPDGKLAVRTFPDGKYAEWDVIEKEARLSNWQPKKTED